MRTIIPIEVAHLTVTERKARGAHYTPPELAEFVASQIVSVWREHTRGRNVDEIDVLDPAVGGGELLKALIYEFSEANRASLRLRGLDNDPAAVTNAREHLTPIAPNVDLDERDFLADLSGEEADLFNRQAPLQKADIIIANPPYVRTQVLGADRAQMLARKFGLRGRVDLSYPFILGMIEYLKPNGVAGIITSNRFLSTRAGISLRGKLSSSVEIVHLWDLGDTKLFEAAVLPCVLLLRKAPSSAVARFTAVYSVSEREKRPDPGELFLALRENRKGIFELGGRDSRYEIQQGNLDSGTDLGSVWRLANSRNTTWQEAVSANTWKTVGELAKVRVGVKTTADPVFIRNDWEVQCPGNEPETLRPLITHHLARRFRGGEPSKMILYTHEIKDGKKRPIDLQSHPNAKLYLETHRERLENRKYVINAGRNWYEIWVPQDPAAWKRPKIIFKDIAVRPTFWLDTSGGVVNGDCYWFTFEGKDATFLQWLALGVLNSHFIEEFYDLHFSNKLYSGRRRFMTQYVSKFPLPDPASEKAKKIAKIAEEIHGCPDLEEELEPSLDAAVFKAFGLLVKEV